MQLLLHLQKSKKFSVLKNFHEAIKKIESQKFSRPHKKIKNKNTLPCFIKNIGSVKIIFELKNIAAVFLCSLIILQTGLKFLKFSYS